MEFWRYYRIIRRRRWLILLGMAVCVGLVAYSNMKSVPEYKARTTIVESKGMTEEGVQMFAERYVQTDDTTLRLSNLVSIASSQTVVQRAVDSLRDLNIDMKPEEILSHITVSPEKDTNIIAIEVTLPSVPNPMESKEDAGIRTRTEAKVAADVIAASLKKRYAELNNSAVTQSREFIEAQILTTRKAMVAAQEKLRQFKEENGIVEVNVQGQSLIQRLESAKSSLNQAQATHDGAVGRLKKQTQELKGIKEWETNSVTTSLSPMWQQIENNLLQLENQRASLLGDKAAGKSGLGAMNPRILELDRQIDETNKKLKSTLAEQYITNSSVKAKNPTYQNALDRYITAKVEEAATNAQMAAMISEVDRIRAEMDALPQMQAKFAELQTDVDSATQTYGLMRSKLDEAKIKEQQVKNEVAIKTIDPAFSSEVVGKQRLKLILALLLSPILGIGAAFLLYYMDNTIKTPADAEKLLGLPVLTAIPESRAHSLVRQRCPEILDVALQMLTSSLWIASQHSELNSLVVVSAEPNVGRSVLASNLAVSLAKEGAKVVLVDADLRQPTQHMIFGLDNNVGLTNIITGVAALEDALIPTKVPGLLVIPAGPVPDNAVKLLRSDEMRSIDEQIKIVADFVIYDTPAGIAFPDPVLVAAQVGTALVVQAAGRVPRGSEADFHNRLQGVGVQMLGAVLNRIKREDSSSYFHYKRSYEGVTIAQLPKSKKALRK